VRLVVLGDPVAHSLSPVLHRAAFASVSLPGHYEARRVDRAAFLTTLEEIRRGVLDGANVTMPHKRLAADRCDRLAPEAERTRAVNTIVRVGRELVGHTTDVAGVVTAARWAELPIAGPVLILGAGGAAAAAAMAFEGRKVFVSARREERAVALLDECEVPGATVPWGRPVDRAVVVNATPVGMKGEELPTPVLEAASGLFDMAYGDAPTPAVAWCRAQSLPVVAGPDMLLAQAVEAFRLWTGRRPSVTAMRSAMNEEMTRRSASPESSRLDP
jgi:shikimate dehydrogenase